MFANLQWELLSQMRLSLHSRGLGEETHMGTGPAEENRGGAAVTGLWAQWARP